MRNSIRFLCSRGRAVFKVVVSDTRYQALVPYLTRIARSLVGDILFGRTVVFALVVVVTITRIRHESVHAVGSTNPRAVHYNINNDSLGGFPPIDDMSMF